mmetsp:Transcript_24009/g.77255  ORF Transcript_24009/g.77255 Transcript_24009/m.77255 type:complete len:200 (-) Transcript_24009:2120-2719(-)
MPRPRAARNADSGAKKRTKSTGLKTKPSGIPVPRSTRSEKQPSGSPPRRTAFASRRLTRNRRPAPWRPNRCSCVHKKSRSTDGYADAMSTARTCVWRPWLARSADESRRSCTWARASMCWWVVAWSTGTRRLKWSHLISLVRKTRSHVFVKTDVTTMPRKDFGSSVLPFLKRYVVQPSCQDFGTSPDSRTLERKSAITA